MNKVQAFANEVPEEIRRAIRGLDSEYRTAIFVVLYKNGELSFSELQKTLEMDKAILNYHLGVLAESALVHHYYKHELGTEKYSFYNITSYGQGFLEILGQLLRPLPQRAFISEGSSAASTRVDQLVSPGWTAASDLNVLASRQTETSTTLPSTS